MSKKKTKVCVITPEMIFDAQKTKYNGFKCGYGVHGKTKYDRNKEKRNFMKEIS